jgi:hypothetical protein
LQIITPPVRGHITSTTTDKATARVFSKISVVYASVDVLVYSGVLTPSPLTYAINNSSLKLVTKLIVIGIYIYISLIYNVNVNLHKYKNCCHWPFQRILHHGYHSIFVHLKMCYIIGQFPMYTEIRWRIEN